MAKKKRDSVINVTEVDPKAEKKARGKAKRARKKAALKLVIDFVIANSTEKNLLATAALLTPGQRIARVGVKEVFKEIFLARKVVPEEEIWSKHKLGRVEMRRVCVDLIKKEKPADRIWVSFDPESGNYVVKGTGSKTPKDWSGYTPVKIDDIEIT